MSRVDSAPRKPTTPPPREAKTEGPPSGVQPGAPGKAAPIGKAVATTVAPAAVPVADGMTQGTQAAAPQVVVAEAGLQTGNAANPFQTLVPQQQAKALNEALRLAELPVGVEVDLAPEEKQLGKLAGLEKHVVVPKGRFAGQQSAVLKAGSKVREGFMMNLSDALPADGDGDALPVAQTRSHVAAVVAAEAGAQRASASVANAMYATKSSFPMGMDVHSFVQAVLREAYLFQSEELKEKGERLKAVNENRRALRKQQRRAEELKLKLLQEGELTDEEYDEFSQLLGIDIVRSEEKSVEFEEIESRLQNAATPEEAAAILEDVIPGLVRQEGTQDEVIALFALLPEGALDNVELYAWVDGLLPVEWVGETPAREWLKARIAEGPITPENANMNEGGATNEPTPEEPVEPVSPEQAAKDQYVSGVNSQPVSEPGGRIHEVEQLVSGDQKQTAKNLLNWIDNGGNIDELIKHGSKLAPQTWANLLAGLLFAQAKCFDVRHYDYFYSKNFAENIGGTNRDGGPAYKLAGLIHGLLLEGSSAQASALLPLIEHQGGKPEHNYALYRSMTDRMPNFDVQQIDGRIYASRGGTLDGGSFVKKLAAADAQNPFPPTSNLSGRYALFDFYNGMDMRSQGDAFKADDIAELKWRIHNAPAREVEAFFKELVPMLLDRPGGEAVLKDLFGAVKPEILESDKYFMWLGDHFPANAPPASDPAGAGNSGGEPPSEEAPPPPDPVFTETITHHVASGYTAQAFEEDREAPVLDVSADREEIEAFLEHELQEFEDAIATQGEDAQLMQLELQDMMQKQQQLMSMMTNMSKMMHDVAMSIIRNMGG
ncbi:MAG: hypothetical protein AAFZ38_11940 [Myxococcota bacterium]